MKIAYICPVYKAGELHNYTMRSLKSFFNTTKDGLAIVVDDASKDWESVADEISQAAIHPGQQVITHHFDRWGGLTRSWNKGLSIASEAGADYVVPSNNDIIFTERWYEGLLHALSHDYALVGPLSNAPGVTANGSAEIWRYVRNYQTNDSQEELDSIARMLRRERMGSVVEAGVNGFFQMGKMSTFEEGRFDANHYYKPRNDRASSGRKNPTPLMTLNEDELQGRWRKAGKKTAVVLSSFIFHYRAVTRGDNYRRGRWYRQNNE